MKPRRLIRIFIGHDYFGGNKKRLTPYRKIFQRACSVAQMSLGIRVEPVYGSTKELPSSLLREIKNAGGDIPGIQKGWFWPRIDGLIRISDLALFDLTLHNGRPSDVNWNVLMELGVAIGAGRSYRILAKNRKAVKRRLTNMDGVEINECPSRKDLLACTTEQIIAFHNGRTLTS